MSKSKSQARRQRTASEANSAAVETDPRPAKAGDDPKFLEQVTLGRWLEFDQIPPDVRQMTGCLAEYISQRCGTSLFGSRPTSSQLQNLRAALQTSYERGYFLAVLRYEDELKRVPELAAWHRQRHKGIDKGHATQSQAREARYQRIRDKWAAMEKAGERPTNETVAAAIRQDGEKKCSPRTVQRAFAELTAKAKPAKRKKR